MSISTPEHRKGVWVKKSFPDTKQVNTVNQCKLVKHSVKDRKVVVNDNKHKTPISVTSHNQQGVNTEKRFSKNRFAPLNDIRHRSHCDDQKVLTFIQSDNNYKGSKNKSHKVGVECGECHTVIDSVSKSHTTNKDVMKTSLCLGHKDAHIQLDLRFHSRHRQKVARAKNCDTFKL